VPSYTLRVIARFEAAHHLTSYQGSPEPVHGHSWRVEAVLETAALDAEGMAWDFVEVQGALRELAARLDHRDINTVPPFDRESPTTERIAAWFFAGLRERLPGAPLAAVTLWEGPDCSATFRP
jgi:6-pyruvoyltetrahydropterin/6-carboxytetrahydropterin synthase